MKIAKSETPDHEEGRDQDARKTRAWFKCRLQLRAAGARAYGESIVVFRGAKGDYRLASLHATRETRNLNHAKTSQIWRIICFISNCGVIFWRDGYA